MSDERDLTPEQEARVARLLADARAHEPIPPEVAARLDRVLEGMAGEHVLGPGEVDAPVLDLAARRRRRVVTLLAAAAAVVVAGVGVGQVVNSQDGGDSGDASSAVDDEAGGAAEQREFDDAAPQQEASPSEAPPLTENQLKALGEPARMTAGSFAQEVRRLQDRPGVRAYATSGPMGGRELAAKEMDFSCGPAEYGVGKLMAVRYNGMPAVLVYRPPAGDTQVVDLLQCGSADVMRSTTIPLP